MDYSRAASAVDAPSRSEGAVEKPPDGRPGPADAASTLRDSFASDHASERDTQRDYLPADPRLVLPLAAGDLGGLDAAGRRRPPPASLRGLGHPARETPPGWSLPPGVSLPRRASGELQTRPGGGSILPERSLSLDQDLGWWHPPLANLPAGAVARVAVPAAVVGSAVPAEWEGPEGLFRPLPSAGSAGAAGAAAAAPAPAAPAPAAGAGPGLPAAAAAPVGLLPSLAEMTPVRPHAPSAPEQAHPALWGWAGGSGRTETSASASGSSRRGPFRALGLPAPRRRRPSFLAPRESAELAGPGGWGGHGFAAPPAAAGGAATLLLPWPPSSLVRAASYAPASHAPAPALRLNDTRRSLPAPRRVALHIDPPRYGEPARRAPASRPDDPPRAAGAPGGPADPAAAAGSGAPRPAAPALGPAPARGALSGDGDPPAAASSGRPGLSPAAQAWFRRCEALAPRPARRCFRGTAIPLRTEGGWLDACRTCGTWTSGETRLDSMPWAVPVGRNAAGGYGPAPPSPPPAPAAPAAAAGGAEAPADLGGLLAPRRVPMCGACLRRLHRGRLLAVYPLCPRTPAPTVEVLGDVCPRWRAERAAAERAAGERAAADARSGGPSDRTSSDCFAGSTGDRGDGSATDGSDGTARHDGDGTPTAAWAGAAADDDGAPRAGAPASGGRCAPVGVPAPRDGADAAADGPAAAAPPPPRWSTADGAPWVSPRAAASGGAFQTLAYLRDARRRGFTLDGALASLDERMTALFDRPGGGE